MSQARTLNRILAVSLTLGLYAVSPPANGQEVRMNADTLHTQSGRVLGTSNSKGDMAGFFKAQKSLVKHILAQVGISVESLPPATQRSLARPQTTSFKALLAFSQGLDHVDNDRFAEAKAAFAVATRIDPGFRLAVTFQAAMPAVNLNVGQITSRTAAQGQGKAQQIISKAESGDESNLGSVIVSQTEGEVSGADVPTTDALGTSATEQVGQFTEQLREQQARQQQSGEAAQEEVTRAIDTSGGGGTTTPITITTITPTPVSITSTPACTGNLCGFYSTFLAKSVLSGENSTTTLATNGFITESTSSTTTDPGVGLTTGGQVVIGQRGGQGHLTGTTSPALGNFTSFNEGATGDTAENIATPVSLEGVIGQSYLDEQGNTAVELGYYTGSFNQLDSRYNLLDGKIWFAEGQVTPTADLSALAQSATTYSYTGVTGATISGSSGTASCATCGTMKANVNFGTSRVTDVHMDAAISNIGAFTVDASSATLNSNGSFAINQGTTGTSFHLGSASEFEPSGAAQGAIQLKAASSLSQAAQGVAVGRTFGRNASNVGGTLSIQTQDSNNHNWAASGGFAGTRIPTTTGSVTGTIPVGPIGSGSEPIH